MKRFISIAISLILAFVLAVGTYAAPLAEEASATDIEEILIPVSRLEEVYSLNSAWLLAPAFYISAGAEKEIGYSGVNSSTYFTTDYGVTCTFQFSSDVSNLTFRVINVSQSRYPYTCTVTLQASGTYRYEVTWTNESSAPYKLYLTNPNSSEAYVTGLVFAEG